MNSTEPIFGEAETARLWAASLRDLAAERAQEGRTAEARELQRQAEVHELAARAAEETA